MENFTLVRLLQARFKLRGRIINHLPKTRYNRSTQSRLKGLGLDFAAENVNLGSIFFVSQVIAASRNEEKSGKTYN